MTLHCFLVLSDAIKQEFVISKIQEPEFCVRGALKQNFQYLLYKEFDEMSCVPWLLLVLSHLLFMPKPDLFQTSGILVRFGDISAPFVIS